MSVPILLLSVAWAIPVAAGSVYFPLEPRAMWSYVGDEGGAEHVFIGGTQVVIGVETVVRHVEVQSQLYGESFENFWTSSGDGDVWLHGFTNETFSLSYDPPILWFDAPLEVGKTWSTTTQPFGDLEGKVPFDDPFTITIGVISEQEIVVPAGKFFAYEVGQVPPGIRLSLNSGVFDFSGQHLDAFDRGDNFNDWVSYGVGIVRFRGLEHYVLETFDFPVSVEPQSWSRLKSLYRQ
ncbi:MAG TPA: hypothetical protein VFR10_04615 [bacterium]|nr:hypothetical protein [bacterium]